MIPAGTFTGRDGRTWINDNPAAVIAASFSHPKLPVDIEHATELLGPKGEEAPAYAWIDAMRVNADGGIEAHVEWTPDGEARVRGKKYLLQPGLPLSRNRSGDAAVQRRPDQQTQPVFTRT